MGVRVRVRVMVRAGVRVRIRVVGARARARAAAAARARARAREASHLEQGRTAHGAAIREAALTDEKYLYTRAEGADADAGGGWTEKK